MRRARPLTPAEARARLQAACDAVGGQHVWADRHGVSRSHVSQVIAGQKKLSPKTMRPLGLARVEPPEAWAPADDVR